MKKALSLSLGTMISCFSMDTAFFGMTDGIRAITQDISLVTMNIEQKNEELLRATKHKNHELMNRVIQFGAQVNSADDLGMTPIMYAAKAADDIGFDVLKRHEACLSGRNNIGTTLFALACMGGNGYILDYCWNTDLINDRNTKKSTPLHAAMYSQEPFIVNRLLEAGAQIDAQDENGITPLMGASEISDHVTVALLLAKGADPFLKDNNGNTGLTYVIDNDSIDCFKAYIKYVNKIADLIDYSGGELYLKQRANEGGSYHILGLWKNY